MTSTSIELTPAAAKLSGLLDEALEILARFPAGRERSALLPLLHLVQSQEGFVSPAGVAFCAEVLGINKAQVGAVATFYTMYKRRPTGDWLVSVCTNTMCNVLGGQEVYDTLTEHLGVGHQETTADGVITLEHAECLAACDYGPVMTVNYDFYDNVTPDSAVGVVEGLKAGERPAPTRGARLCTLKEMSKQLAGFPDPRIEAIGDGPAGPPTLRGVTLAQDNGIAVRGFDPETPIATTKPVERPPGAGKGGVAGDGTAKGGDGKVVTAARKVAETVADTVKSAAATVAEKATSRKNAPRAATNAGGTDGGGDAKDPEVRTAETRNPDGFTPATDPAGTAQPAPAVENPAEAAGAAANAPAGDAKPAGDEGTGAQERNLNEAKDGGK